MQEPTRNDVPRGRLVVMIASPLEPEHVAAIAAVAPDFVDVIYRPDLLPPTRYVADHQGDPSWRRTPAQQAEWHALLARANVLWDFSAGEERGPLDLSPELRWVQTTSAGVGQYVRRLGLQESDLIVTTSSGVHIRPLTEFVLAALLFHVKQFANLQEEQRSRSWNRYCAAELTGQTMAIIGPGRIGREIARIARAFGMTIWAMARTNDDVRLVELGVDRIFPRSALQEMLAGADCVVLCAPHTPETEGILGPSELAAMKPGAVFVNIARGTLVDEDALIANLQSGRIAFAALDVFRTEPLPVESPLWALPNVLINPHSASTANSENGKITDLFVQNLRHFLAGEFHQMSPVLDKMRLY